MQQCWGLGTPLCELVLERLLDFGEAVLTGDAREAAMSVSLGLRKGSGSTWHGSLSQCRRALTSNQSAHSFDFGLPSLLNPENYMPVVSITHGALF